jgi:phosphoserine phosphatase
MGVKLFLIRHGQTLWNKEGRYQGDEDISLTPEGIRQAKLISRYLSKVDFASIYSSPLKRAADTAAFVREGRKANVILREDLKEANFGEWEGMKFDSIDGKFHGDYTKWLKDPYNNSPTGGESFKVAQERAIKEINNIIRENKDNSNVAVVTHGGIISCLLVYWLKIPVSRWWTIIQRQGAISIIIIDEGFPYVLAINYTGHLEQLYDEKEDKIIEAYSSLRNEK